MKKLTNAQFESILQENLGIYARTATAIQNTYGIKYSRQAVRDRAAKFKDLMAECQKIVIERAEESMLGLLGDRDKKIRFNASRFVLSRLGKDKWSEKHQIDIASVPTIEIIDYGANPSNKGTARKPKK